MSIDFDVESDGIHGVMPVESAVHVDELKFGQETQGTHNASLGAIDPLNTEGAPSLVGRASPIDVEAVKTRNAQLESYREDLQTYASNLQAANVDSPLPVFPKFPDPAKEGIDAGLERTRQLEGQINQHIEAVEAQQKDIDSLLDLSSQLTAHKPGEPISEKMRALLLHLKEERKIDLWQGNETHLSKEQISDLKSIASEQVSRLRSNIQITFSTKIQMLLQFISMINDTLKKLIDYQNKLIGTTNRLPGH
jgi:hypothetical protein